MEQENDHGIEDTVKEHTGTRQQLTKEHEMQSTQEKQAEREGERNKIQENTHTADKTQEPTTQVDTEAIMDETDTNNELEMETTTQNIIGAGGVWETERGKE
jgi:CRISPR/Cas system CMR subunit Cmr6 (Cas7 group RAMP superfamily)